MIDWLQKNHIRVVSDGENTCGIEPSAERVDLEISSNQKAKSADHVINVVPCKVNDIFKEGEAVGDLIYIDLSKVAE